MKRASETETASRGSLARRVVSACFYAAVLGLLVWFVLRIDLRPLARVELRWAYLAGAAAVGLAQRLLLPLIWVWIVRDLGVRVRDYAAYNFVYAKAWLGRYLPGKVAMVAARVYFAEELGASRSVMLVSSLAEIGAQLLVGGAVGLLGVASLARSVPELAPYEPAAFALLGALALFCVPRVFNGTMRLGFRLARRSTEDHPDVGPQTMARALLGFVAFAAASGVLAVLVAGAVDPALVARPVLVGGAYNLAITLGMLFLFTPSGIGAREAVQLPLLALVAPPERALAVVVLCRLLEVAVDLLFYAVAAAWARARRAR